LGQKKELKRVAVRLIVKHPDSILREKAVKVKKFNARIHKLLDDMAETMYDAEGVGLAAPQIGISKRVAVVDAGDEHGLVELVNPQIVEQEGEELGVEGCLSIPGLTGEVRRAKKIKVTAQDRDGQPFTLEATDLLARAIQHEIDHLNGVLFIDLAEKMYDRTEDETE
jgi:peptide deformylase